MKDYLKIAGKTAIVTGSGRGIGRGVAAGLASYGAKVMVADINDENGVKVRDEIIAEGGVADYCHCEESRPVISLPSQMSAGIIISDLTCTAHFI